MSIKLSELPPELKQLALLRAQEYVNRGQKSQKNMELELERNREITYLFNYAATGDGIWEYVHNKQDIEKHNEYAKSIVGAIQPRYELY